MELKAKKVTTFDIVDPNPYGIASYLRFVCYKNKDKTLPMLELDSHNSYICENKDKVVAFLRSAADAIEARKS